MKRALAATTAVIVLATASPTNANQKSPSGADAVHLQQDIRQAADPVLGTSATASGAQTKPSTAGTGPALIVQPAAPARWTPGGMEIPVIGFALSALLYLLAKL
jgi:hypothetical protein